MRPVKTWSTPVNAEEKNLVPCTLCGGTKFKASFSCDGFSYVRCVSCSLVQINPQPLEREISERYNVRFGGDYLSYELANEKVFLNLQLLALKDVNFWELEEKLIKNRSNAAPGKKMRILDIGCATGSLLALLSERGWETTGVEISAPQAEYGCSTRKVDIRKLSLEENHFPDEYFDVILASHLIEHLNDPGAMAGEVSRILAPGGSFFVTTPNIAGFQALVFKGRWRSAIFDHLYLFSKKTLKKLLTKKGFTIEKTATWGGLAAGTAPLFLKCIADRMVKWFGGGDVMIIRAVKLAFPQEPHHVKCGHANK